MRENGLRGRHKRRFKATTDSKHTLPVAPNRLDQNFETERSDHAWTADIAYFATAGGRHGSRRSCAFHAARRRQRIRYVFSVAPIASRPTMEPAASALYTANRRAIRMKAGLCSA